MIKLKKKIITSKKIQENSWYYSEQPRFFITKKHLAPIRIFTNPNRLPSALICAHDTSKAPPVSKCVRNHKLVTVVGQVFGHFGPLCGTAGPACCAPGLTPYVSGVSNCATGVPVQRTNWVTSWELRRFKIVRLVICVWCVVYRDFFCFWLIQF